MPTPDIAQDFSPDIEQGVTPDFLPEITPDETPEITPDVTQDFSLDITPDFAPDIAQETSFDFSEPAEDRLSLESWAAAITAPPTAPTEPGSSDRASVWYLGLDFGTTGLSAVLLNTLNCQLYPLYWAEPHTAEPALVIESEARFRLPTVLSFPPQTDFSVRLHDLKPFLKLGIPYQAAFSKRWEPVVQWTEAWQIPLIQMMQAVEQLLLTLMEPNCGALGLEDPLPTVLQQLAGIIVGCPSQWSEAYRCNLRQVILNTRLLNHPEQIYFTEETIAALLSVLQSSDGREIVLSHNQQRNDLLTAENEPGNTLILNAGATITELALVGVPADLSQLTDEAFQIRSIPYAGHAIDQDIICQLLYPSLRAKAESSQGLEEAQPFILDPQTTVPHDFTAAAISLRELNLEQLRLPIAGESDLISRYALQQRLEGSPSGQLLLVAARQLKLTLQHQSRFSLQLGNWQDIFLRQDLSSQVLLPYIQRLNRELNSLLTQAQLSVAEVNQVICTGGTASLGAIARWLRQKLPNATIIQDTYGSNPTPDNCIPSCSRIAYGLAVLPLHPQLLDRSSIRDDYAVLLALLRLAPNRPVSVDSALRQLKAQGIQAEAAQVQALLENRLPTGLVPSEAETGLLAAASLQNPDYQAIQVAPLFYSQGDQTYLVNPYQATYCKSYLEAILAGTEQRPLRV